MTSSCFSSSHITKMHRQTHIKFVILKQSALYLMFAWWWCCKKQTRNQRSVGICEVALTFLAGCHCPLCSRSAGRSLMLQRADHSSPNLCLIKWSALLLRTPVYQDSLMAFPSLAPQIMRRLITPWPLPAKGFLVCHIYPSFEAEWPIQADSAVQGMNEDQQ